MSNNHKQTWLTYSQAWKVPTAQEKRVLMEKSLNQDCVYTDPMTQAKGWDELLAYMLKFHEDVPGGFFETIQFMTHNNRSVARWQMRNAQNETIGDGISYVEFDNDGRLKTMTGFFETPSQTS